MVTGTLGVKAVFDRALEIEAAAERQAYLDEACAAAPELRHQVEALLGVLGASFIASHQALQAKKRLEIHSKKV